MADQEMLDARAKVLAQARAALDALVIWELTHSKDLRRYHRASVAMGMASDLEKAYATRVADVDAGEDTPLGRGVMEGRINIRNVHVDRDPLGDFERNVRLGAAVDDANRAGIALQPDLAPLAQTAEALLRGAHRAIDQLPPREADRVIDRVNGVPPMIAPVLDAEARRAIGEEPFGDVPAHVRAAVHEATRRDPRGAPYGEPPQHPLLAALPDHLRPFVGLYQEAMDRMQPDHVTRIANRITALTEAINAASVVGHDVSALDRELRDTLADLEHEHIPPATRSTAMIDTLPPVWFIPSWWGDIRLESLGGSSTKVIATKLTEGETAALAALTAAGHKKGWLDKAQTLGEGETAIGAPIDKVSKVIAKALKPGRKLVSAIVFSNGEVQEHREVVTDEKAAGVKPDAVIPPKRKPKAGTTVAAPVRGCPAPDFAMAELKAQTVLEHFLDQGQIADCRKYGRFVSIGHSGRRYMVTSRHQRDQLATYHRSLFDLDDKAPICTHDWDVPAPEEMLALHLMVSLPGWELWVQQLESEEDHFDARSANREYRALPAGMPAFYDQHGRPLN